MAEITYRMLQNGFDSQTAKSHKKAISLITDTMDKLRPSAILAEQLLFNNFEPHFDAYIALNVAVEIAEGTYKGKTASFEQVMSDVPKKLKVWEGGIHAIFPEDTPEEIEIFPQKRKIFYDGTYETRLLAIKALSVKLLEYTVAHPSLVPVQADVAAFHTLAHTTRQVQQGKEGGDGTLRIQREAQRVATMGAYWGLVYGGLLGLYYATPAIIGQYIDFGLLYDHKQEELIENIIMPPGGGVRNVPLVDVAVTATTKFRIKNLNTNPGELAIVYFAASTSTDPGDAPVGMVFNPGDNKIVTAAQLGFEPAKLFLNIATSSPVAVELEIYEVN